MPNPKRVFMLRQEIEKRLEDLLTNGGIPLQVIAAALRAIAEKIDKGQFGYDLKL